MAYPTLTVGILTEIIKDGLAASPPINRLGLVGSYARGDKTSESDVDIIIDTNHPNFDDILATVGSYASTVLNMQFNKRLEIIPYDLAKKRAETPPPNIENWYYQEGYQQMLKEVQWIYER